MAWIIGTRELSEPLVMRRRGCENLAPPIGMSDHATRAFGTDIQCRIIAIRCFWVIRYLYILCMYTDNRLLKPCFQYLVLWNLIYDWKTFGWTYAIYGVYSKSYITGNVHIGYRRPDWTCGVSQRLHNVLPLCFLSFTFPREGYLSGRYWPCRSLSLWVKCSQLWQCRREVNARIDSLQRFPLAVENRV